MKNTGRDHLEVLSKSKSKMAEGQPNLQKWKIVDHTGEKIGTVYDVLFDTEAKKVRYIIANLNNGKLLKQDRLVLMPIGRCRYRKSEEEVIFPNITRDQLSALPDFLTVDRLTKEDEISVRNAFKSEDQSAISKGDQDWDTFYDHEDFDENVFYDHAVAPNKETRTDTTSRENEKVKESKNEPVSASKDVKAGSGTDPRLTGTAGKQHSSGNDKKRNEEVNVHPGPEERSADRSELGNSTKGERDMTDTEKRNPGRAKGDNDLR